MSSEKHSWENLLSFVKTYSYKKGDRIPVCNFDDGGVIEKVADGNGFIFMVDSKPFHFVVTQLMIDNAKHISLHERKHGPLWDKSLSIEDKKCTVDRLYRCKCIGNYYLQSIYKQWEKSERKKKNIHGEFRPVNWPESWKDGRCLHCGCFVSVNDISESESDRIKRRLEAWKEKD